MRPRRLASSVFGFVLALAALSGAGCSAIVSPDTSRFGPGELVDGGDPPRDDDAGVEPEDDASVEPGGDAGGGDDGGTPPIDAGETCTGEPRCEGTTLTRCEGGSPVVTTCPVACSSDGTRCADFAPSNVGAALWIEGAEDATVSAMTVFNTSTCSATMAGSRVESQSGGPDVCVLQVRNLTIAEGGVLSVVGSRPLIVMATGDVEIRGTIDVSAQLTQPGPGGSIGGGRGEPDGIGAGGGAAGQREGTYEDGGGAGGAFCGAGGAGGDGGDGTGGEASARVDAMALSPLRGGSGGGIGPGGAPFGSGTGNIGLGGAGGGALQISARGRIRVSGSILGGGGGGSGGGNSSTYTNFGAGGGGGSGGGILLESPEVLFEGAILAASGGGGGGGSGDRDGGDGQDGRALVGPATGGTTGGGRYAAAGGDSGGGATIDAQAGATNTGSGSNGGGGGGGAGCIVIRNASGSLPAGTTSGWSPSSDGVLITRVRTL